MKAMILAAGLGTRLEPLNRVRPKSLFPVVNRPLLGVIIEQLKGLGVNEIIINVHHLAEKVEDFVHNERWGLKVEVRFEPEILGTGGGIKNCSDFFQDVPFFLVVNSDIYHTFDLRPPLNYHIKANNLATLVLYDNPFFNQVGVDRAGRIVSIRGEEVQRSYSPPSIMTFTGIHIISAELLGYLPPSGYFDIVQLYVDLARRGEGISGYKLEGGYWRDIGRIEDYWALHRDLLGKQGETVLHPTAYVGEGVRMEAVVCVGRETYIGAESVIKDSILWDEVVVEEGAIVEECIVGDRVKIGGQHKGEVLASDLSDGRRDNK